MNGIAAIITNQWDLFLNETRSFDSTNTTITQEDAISLLKARNLCVDNNYFFRKYNETSYNLFRDFYTILDIIVFDKNHFNFQPIALVLSIVHQVLDKRFHQQDLVSFASGNTFNKKKFVQDPTTIRDTEKVTLFILLYFR